MTGEEGARLVLMLLDEFAPVQRGEVRGLSDREIDALELSIARRFCVGHRAFLRHFGATPKGALNPFVYDYEFSQRDIREYYSTYTNEGWPGWAFWANIGADPCPFHVFAQEFSVEDPGLGFPELNRILHESLWNHLIFSAYCQLIAPKYDDDGGALDGWLWEGRIIPLAEAAEPFAFVQQLMMRIGFERWIDMANAQCMMRRGETVAWFGRSGSRPNTDSLQVSICGPDMREIRETWEVLADNAGLVDYPIRSS